MAPALFTTGQSRWALHILLALLSAVAIASSAPSSAGGESDGPSWAVTHYVSTLAANGSRLEDGDKADVLQELQCIVGILGI